LTWVTGSSFSNSFLESVPNLTFLFPPAVAPAAPAGPGAKTFFFSFFRPPIKPSYFKASSSELGKTKSSFSIRSISKSSNYLSLIKIKA